MSDLRRLARFAFVGGAATATHLFVGLLLAEGAGAEPFWANAAAFGAAVLVSYFGNLVWTFEQAEAGLAPMPRFMVVALCGLAANQAIVFTMVDLAGWSYRLALAVVLLVVPGLTFLASRSWVFATVPPGR